MKKIKALIFIGLVLLLSGCQLAREWEERERSHEDEMIGFFVTFWDDDIHRAFGNEDRIYAIQDRFNFTFPINGIPFFVGVARQDLDDGTYISFAFGETGDGIVQEYFHLHHGDGFTRRTLRGTLYISPRIASEIFTFNPIFQTAQNAVYIGRGGSSVSSHSDSDIWEGDWRTFSKQSEIVTTVNGVSHTRTTNIELGLRLQHAAETITIIQMDENHHMLTRDVFAPADMPGDFTPLSHTAYLIIEAFRPYAQIPVQRSLVGEGDGDIVAFYEGENGVLIRRFTQVVW
ncbi:MAG: membrane lipoprotein lipid attachment site-containing protein [Defluviitaleaceae bacterium]|nr:membrane lipoprotein lipid attachment site-containing protein [Defluviitaleaceae bacterium]MCL2275589.1 membrane lipoprotein lipid attachment site-containing protein [Defluviitaleaceae bacterium]